MTTNGFTERNTHTHMLNRLVNLFFIGTNREKNNFLSNNLVTQYWSKSDRLDFLIDYANTILLFLRSLSLFSALLTIILTLDIDTYMMDDSYVCQKQKKKKNSRTSFVPLENFRHSTREYFRMRDTHAQNQRKPTELLLLFHICFLCIDIFLTKINFPFNNGSEDKTTNLIQFALLFMSTFVCLKKSVIYIWIILDCFLWSYFRTKIFFLFH